MHMVTMQAVGDGRTDLAGNELIPSSSPVNFVKTVSQVENVGSEYGIMSYFLDSMSKMPGMETTLPVWLEY